MRVTTLFGETIREAPNDTEIVSHQLMLRAGFIRQLASGIFSYLPLAQRSLRKIEAILREEMDAIGGQEIAMPVVHPAELWQQTGRWQAIDETMVRFKDRRGHDMLLAMTHEEVVAELARSEIRSYRQLPQMVYQLQTKFRDEPRARGGLIRVREFIMKDSYTLDRDEEGLREQYVRHYDAYHRIGLRAGLSLTAVGSDVGMMGGQEAHEFMFITPIGEDTLAVCPHCGYAANQEVALFRKTPGVQSAPAPLEKVATPGAKTIQDLCACLGIEARQTCKAVFFVAGYGAEKPARLVIALVRGDMDANPILVKNAVQCTDLRSALVEEIAAAGMVAGYASPVGVTDRNVFVLADTQVAEETSLAAGANEEGYHYINVCMGRDFVPEKVTNIALADEGFACVDCGSPLQMKRGVEVGNIFQLGTRYTAAMGATYLGEDGSAKPIVMGSYGIGVGRLLACAAEQHRDERGLALPMSIAPYQVSLISLCRTEEAQIRAEELYRQMLAEEIEVLFDDRKEVSAGVKFADADLRGLPLQMVISERSLTNGGVEWKLRTGTERTMVPLEEAVNEAKTEIERQLQEIRISAANAPRWHAASSAKP